MFIVVLLMKIRMRKVNATDINKTIRRSAPSQRKLIDPIVSLDMAMLKIRMPSMSEKIDS